MPRADRLFVLVQLLSGPSRRTLAELTAALDASPRSIYRDLADLEARGLAIERGDGGYRLLQSSAVRAAPLTARERLLLTLALENRGIQSQPLFQDALRSLRFKLARDESRAWALGGPDRSGSAAEAVTASLEQAINRSHSVSLLYTSLNSGRRWRGVDPWIVIHRSEAWYLIGRCHVHDEPRTFRLDRIAAVLPIGESFERPADFDPQKWFSTSWGVETACGTQDVRIVFDPSVAPLIEHARHHPAESKERRTDGSLDYRVQIGALNELARWIAGFGGMAVALSPPELVSKVREIAEGAATAHRKPMRRSAKRIALGKGLTETDSRGSYDDGRETLR